jgi:hypothetical protein
MGENQLGYSIRKLTPWKRVRGHEYPERWVIVPRPQIHQPGGSIMLLAGEAVHRTTGAAADQQAAVRLIGGSAIHRAQISSPSCQIHILF